LQDNPLTHLTSNKKTELTARRFTNASTRWRFKL